MSIQKISTSHLEQQQIAFDPYLVLKFIFYPITYILNKICAPIAFYIGVGANREISTQKRQQLRSLGGQEIQLRTEDNLNLEGMHFRNPNPIAGAKTVLICTGSHQSYEHYAVPMVDALLKMGHHVMVFNYRGFGSSEGSPSEEGFNLDAQACYKYLTEVQGKTDRELTVLGYSMGAAPATDLASRHPISLILDRYFSSMMDVAYDNGGFIAKSIFYLGGAGFDLKEKIVNVTGKILLARGKQDTTMRPYHQNFLMTAFTNHQNTTFIEVESSHQHSSNSSLWFHPDNPFNATSQARLNTFLRT